MVRNQPSNHVLKYSLTLFALLALITVGANIFSSAIIEAFSLSLPARITIIFLESIITAAIITIFSINALPVIREMMVTIRRLVRFDNLSHPLLVRLSQEAPATYHHAMMVANLGHRAAKAIQANPIMTRVGAYYHDIGKLSHPERFAENQPAGSKGVVENVHDYLSPKESSKIIFDHVKDGVSIATEHHLPTEIINFISQHHGTSVAQYFYQEAKHTGLKVRKHDFRYPGPKPLSKETAIIMLADGIESKARSLPELTESAIQQTVDEIIADKLNDDQLELSGLTARDLGKIRLAFIEGLKVMSHRRIRYPGQ